MTPKNQLFQFRHKKTYWSRKWPAGFQTGWVDRPLCIWSWCQRVHLCASGLDSRGRDSTTAKTATSCQSTQNLPTWTRSDGSLSEWGRRTRTHLPEQTSLDWIQLPAGTRHRTCCGFTCGWSDTRTGESQICAGDVEKLGDVWDLGFNLVMAGAIMVHLCLSGSGAKGRPQREAILLFDGQILRGLTRIHIKCGLK